MIKENPLGETTLEGVPLGVQLYSGNVVARLSVVIKVKNNAYVLCYASNLGLHQYDKNDLLDAAALIESEMNDGDNEEIKLRGYYEGKRFRATSILVNGHMVTQKD